MLTPDELATCSLLTDEPPPKQNTSPASAFAKLLVVKVFYGMLDPGQDIDAMSNRLDQSSVRPNQGRNRHTLQARANQLADAMGDDLDDAALAANL